MKEIYCDVAVIGGGPAGTVAAIAAARMGSETVLIERNGFLGGTLTACGTGPMMSFHAGNTQVIKGIADEIIEEMKQRGYSSGHMPDAVGFCATTTAFDTEGLKIVLEDLAADAGVHLLFHTDYIGCELEGEQIKAVILHAKGGNFKLIAQVFIDASADADLAADAGVPTVYGRDSDGQAQPMTMNARVYGVDREKLCHYIMENIDDMSTYTPRKLSEYSHFDISGAYSKVKQAKQNGVFNIERDMVLCFETHNSGEYIVNMSRVLHYNVLDPFDMTKAEIEGRKQVQELLAFLRAYIPGFEHCCLAYSGPNIGVRESRKICGMYRLKKEDLLNNIMFEDAIAMGGYPIDVHNPDGEKTDYSFLKKGSWYSIPYRVLITQEISNLIVTGRCVSSTQEANAAIRVTPIIMGFSQGAGVAAALCARRKQDVRTLDTGYLRKYLKKQGVFLEEYRLEEHKKTDNL